MKHALTIFLGALLIAVITPLVQFSTLNMTNHDLETAAASGWAFGFLFAFILAALVLRLITRKPWLNRGQVVILFAMLSIAVPVMNLGLIRPMILMMRAVQVHFVNFGVDTYRRAYQEQSPDWFPVVPTTEGLAHHKADRLLRLLNDDRVTRRRQAAMNNWLLEIQIEARRAERGEAPREEIAETLLSGLDDLGLVELERVRQTIDRDESLREIVDTLELDEPVRATLAALQAGSQEARESLEPRLLALDERTLYFVPTLRSTFDRGIQGRLIRLEEQLPADERANLLHRGREVDQELASLRGELMRLGERDRAALLRLRREAHLEDFAAMNDRDIAALRTEFIFRSRTQERRTLFGQRAEGDVPGHDLSPLEDSVFRTSQEKDDFYELPFFQRVGFIRDRVSWEIWLTPLLRWGSLFLVLFVFMMCLADWLRRKWVERENLAFPLVEVADSLIRHDFRLETAEDLLHPERRKGLFSPVFWAGFALGMLILVVEGMGHYGPGSPKVMALDVTENLFATGVLRELNNLVFVLSPILVGLFFLVSLEISFSVWALYLIYRITFLAIGLNAQGAIRDPNHVGWAARGFPFELEQLLGAGICFGIILLFKSVERRKTKAQPEAGPAPKGNPYLPGTFTKVGLVLMPVLAFLLIRDLGMRHTGMALIFGAILLLLTISSARMRAETGLPMQHVTYDFTRLPMVLGMSGAMGVKSFLNYFALAFLPVTLLFRLLPQQLENLELARRHQVKGILIAVASLVAFVTAVGTGMFSLLILSHWIGGDALGIGASGQGPDMAGVMSYPLWVSHFLGEEGLDTFTRPHAMRLLFVGIGAAVFGVLTILRSRVLKFPFHPLGYLLLLFSIYHVWISPYHKGISGADLGGASWLWGSAFVAWGLKSLIIKYGGMNTYRNAKPGFIGLIVGALVAVFLMNLVDLSVSIRAVNPAFEPSDTQKMFIDNPAFTPGVY
jgi:biotin transporter BioY